MCKYCILLLCLCILYVCVCVFGGGGVRVTTVEEAARTENANILACCLEEHLMGEVRELLQWSQIGKQSFF